MNQTQTEGQWSELSYLCLRSAVMSCKVLHAIRYLNKGIQMLNWNHIVVQTTFFLCFLLLFS